MLNESWHVWRTCDPPTPRPREITRKSYEHFRNTILRWIVDETKRRILHRRQRPGQVKRATNGMLHIGEVESNCRHWGIGDAWRRYPWRGSRKNFLKKVRNVYTLIGRAGFSPRVMKSLWSGKWNVPWWIEVVSAGKVRCEKIISPAKVIGVICLDFSF